METPVRRSIRLASSSSKSEKTSTLKPRISPRNILTEVTNTIQNSQQFYNADVESPRASSTRSSSRKRASHSLAGAGNSSSSIGLNVVNDHTNPFWSDNGGNAFVTMSGGQHSAFNRSDSRQNMVTNETPPHQFLDDRFLMGTESPAHDQEHESTPLTAPAISAASTQLQRTASRQRKSASKSLRSASKKPSKLSREITMDDDDDQIPTLQSAKVPSSSRFEIVFKLWAIIASFLLSFILNPAVKMLQKVKPKFSFKLSSLRYAQFRVPKLFQFSSVMAFILKSSKSVFALVSSIFRFLWSTALKITKAFDRFMRSRSEFTRSRIQLVGFLFVSSSIMYWIKSMGVFDSVSDMVEENISHFEVGSHANSYQEINSRFDRLEDAIIQILKSKNVINSDYASKKEFESLVSQLNGLTESVKELSKSKSLLASEDSSSTIDEYKDMFSKWVAQSKNEFGDLIEKYPSLNAKIDSLKDELASLAKKSAEHDELLNNLSQELKSFSLIEQKLSLLVLKELDKVIPSRVIGHISDEKIELHPKFLSLLKAQFMSKDSKVSPDEKEINALVNHAMERQSLTKKDILKHFEKEISQIMEKVNTQKEQSEAITGIRSDLEKIKATKNATLSLENEDVSGAIKGMIDQIVGNALERYSADRIALPDFALATTGSKVVSSWTSPTYHSPNGYLARLLNLGVSGNPPIVALTSDVSLGNCWSVHGNRANLTIALATAIVPTDFTIEHVSKSLTVDISSAPKKIQVYGIPDSGKKSMEFKFLGEYEYDPFGTAIQTFPAQLPLVSEPIRMIQLRILSNHGHKDFTCLYRFRVHSK